MPVIRNMCFACRQIVAQQHIEHLRGCFRRIRLDLDESARGRVHRGEAHHIRVIFTKALGALDIRLGAAVAKLCEHSCLLLLGIGEPGLAFMIDFI